MYKNVTLRLRALNAYNGTQLLVCVFPYLYAKKILFKFIYIFIIRHAILNQLYKNLR